jgi:hypothetical protein
MGAFTALGAAKTLQLGKISLETPFAVFSPQNMLSSKVPGFRRREWLRVGGLGALGISLSGLTRGVAKALPAPEEKGASFGRAKSCILLFLSGGPPQHDTFDPKPEAPLEVRGTFRAIPTNVPGLNLCETLPRTARVANRLAVIRSMTTDINAHSTSGAFMLTGYLPPSKAENVPAGPEDWPSIAAAMGALKPSTRSPLSSVLLPELIHNNGNIVWPGQLGGFMGAPWHPMMLRCDPTQQPMQVEGLSLADGMTSVRLAERFDLFQQFDAHFRENVQSDAMGALDHMHHKAFDVLHSEASRRAFEIERESAALRDKYGRHKFGQSVLLARRLVEAGVRLVQVNWPRTAGDENLGNPLWDTHQNNAGRVRDVLGPQFDGTFATLIADLEARGLLEETLVVVMGGVWAFAENQCQRRMRPLGLVLFRRTGRGGNWRRTNYRRERSSGCISGVAPGATAGPGGNHLPFAGTRPGLRVCGSAGASATADRQRAAAAGTHRHVAQASAARFYGIDAEREE